MTKLSKHVALLALGLAVTASAGVSAQHDHQQQPAAKPAQDAKAPMQRVSPHEEVSATFGDDRVTIQYGRPSMKGRKIFGGLVPYDKVWRTGADEATKLTTTADLTIGGLAVPAGSYSLFTLPTEQGWKLIVNKTADQWGAFRYDQAQDLGRVDLQVTKSDKPVEQFTIELVPQGEKSGLLRLSWENTVASVPFTVK